MIFVAGIHGVGKSYFANKIKQDINIDFYDASRLIEEEKKITFSKDKKVKDADLNQEYLVNAVNRLRCKQNDFLLNGHFSLIDDKGDIVCLDYLVIKMLAPQKIILLEEDVDIVSKRRLERDGIELSNTFIKHFLETERKCAYGFAEENNIPILIINARKDYERGKAFIV